MADGGNVLELGAFGAAIKELKANIPIGVQIDQIANQPRSSMSRLANSSSRCRSPRHRTGRELRLA
jgi:hypothetical protein